MIVMAGRNAGKICLANDDEKGDYVGSVVVVMGEGIVCR